MENYGVTDEGFVVKRMDDIMEQVHSDLTEGLGFDTSANPTSFLNVFVTTFCGQIADLWEELQNNYYSKYPATAQGLNLDNAIQYGGVTRKRATATVYPLHCSGTDGTVVGISVRVGSDTNPQYVLVPVKEFTISRSSCNGAKVRIVSTEQGTFSVNINNTEYSYTSSSEDGALDILNGLKAAINISGYTISVDEDEELLIITDNTKTRSNVMALSDNLTTEEVTTIANFQTVQTGAISLVNGCVTQMIDNLSGFESVNNYITPIYGRDAETDSELRANYATKSFIRSYNMVDSIAAELLENITDVVSAKGYENDTDTTDSYGLPPHSIEMIVEGGDEYAIANVILKKKAGGIHTHGSTEIEVAGVNNDTFKIKFSRPSYLYTWLKVTLHGNEEDIAVDYDSLVKQSIIDYCSELRAGEDLLIQKLIEGIYNTVSGITYVDISVATDTSESAEPETYTQKNVEVTPRQLVNVNTSRIEVMVDGNS